MSRIGKHPVAIPSGVTVELKDGTLSAQGKLGEGSLAFPQGVLVSIEDGKVWVKPADASQQARALWGTLRNRVHNLIHGVAEGFKKKLMIQGVGFRAAMQGSDLVLQLGFSHEVRITVPKGLKITCPVPTEIEIFGADAQQVGQVAAEIRAHRRPEPYKGKGVRYEGEFVRHKEGKKK